MEQTPSLSKALDAAKEFSLKHGLNYLSPDVLCYGCFQQQDSMSFLSPQDASVAIDALAEHLMQAEKNAAKNYGGPAPITVDAAITLLLAEQYANLLEDDELDLCHVLMAIFSCDFFATGLLKERGWVFKNYSDRLLVERQAEIVIESQLAALTEYFPRQRTLSFYQRFFNSESRVMRSSRYLNDAVSLVKFKDYERAVIAAEKADKHAKRSYYFFSRKIYILRKCRKWDAVIKTIKQGRSENFAATLLEYQSGRHGENLFIEAEAFCRLQMGDYDASIKLYQRALELAPANAGLWYNNIGFALQRAERYDGSIPFFDEAIARNPSFAFALNNKGYSLAMTGDPQSGTELIDRSLQIDKGNSYAFRNLALIAKKDGNDLNARQFAEKAVLFGYQEDFGNDIDSLL